MKQINAFDKILGTPAWGAKRGAGSFLTLEFGSPRLRVRNPILDSEIEQLRRRRITICGTWHLWIQSDKWEILENQTVIVNSFATDGSIEIAIAKIDGRILDNVYFDEVNKETLFEFEDSFHIKTYSVIESNSPQWSLYRPDENVDECTHDGKIQRFSALE